MRGTRIEPRVRICVSLSDIRTRMSYVTCPQPRPGLLAGDKREASPRVAASQSPPRDKNFGRDAHIILYYLFGYCPRIACSSLFRLLLVLVSSFSLRHCHLSLWVWHVLILLVSGAISQAHPASSGLSFAHCHSVLPSVSITSFCFHSRPL